MSGEPRRLENSILGRRTQHIQLCDRASHLNETLSALFPSTSTNESLGRLKLFSKIISEKKFDLDSRESEEYLIQVCNITTRAGKKKILDLFEELELVRRQEHAFVPTRKGESLWSFLTLMSKENPELKNSNELTLTHFSNLDIRISTDGKNETNLFHEWCLHNQGKEPILEQEFSAYGDIPFEQAFRLKHSANISEYKIVKDTFNHKRFLLKFKEPILTGQMLRFWYSYDWPSMYQFQFKEWDYSLILQHAPVREVSIRYILNKTHEITKNEFNIYEDTPKENSTSLGEQKILDPIFIEGVNHKEIIWRLKNWPTFKAVKLSWKFA